MNRIEQARELSVKYGFQASFAFVEANNPGNRLPYHNWFHTCCMICNCLEGATYHDLSFQQHHLLGLAALFHDYNHSGGVLSDDQNIMRAVQAWWDNNKTSIPLSQLDQYQVEACIRVTEYPFVKETNTIEQKIIRDADLMQMLEPEWYDHVILGLQAEFKARGINYSLQQILYGNIEFLMKHIPAGLFTVWAKEKFCTPLFGQRLQECVSRAKELDREDEMDNLIGQLGSIQNLIACPELTDAEKLQHIDEIVGLVLG